MLIKLEGLHDLNNIEYYLTINKIITSTEINNLQTFQTKYFALLIDINANCELFKCLENNIQECIQTTNQFRLSNGIKFVGQTYNFSLSTQDDVDEYELFNHNLFI